jgi:hypothetical protein
MEDLLASIDSEFFFCSACNGGIITLVHTWNDIVLFTTDTDYLFDSPIAGGFLTKDVATLVSGGQGRWDPNTPLGGVYNPQRGKDFFFCSACNGGIITLVHTWNDIVLFTTDTDTLVSGGQGRWDPNTPLGGVYNALFNKPSMLEGLEPIGE